ncbi:MAG: T9SS type A sorting domain-containing protein [Proteobacteria bacterium]|nr:T9SS type A sorting domain-containing protein [Pseudomonadota bacterium]
MLVNYIDNGVPSVPDTVFICDDDSGISIPGTRLDSFTYFCSGADKDIDTVIIATNGNDTITSGDFWIEYRTVSNAQDSILLMSDKNTPPDSINYWSTDEQTWNLDNVNEPLAAYVTYLENAQIAFDRDTIKIVYPLKNSNSPSSRSGLDSICYHSIEIDSTVSYFTNINLYSAVRFTPPQYPITIESTKVFFYITGAGSFQDTLFLWEDDSGNPGNIIKAVVWNDSFTTSGTYALNIPLNNTFYSGDYWLGTVSDTNSNGDSILLCTDTTTKDNSGRNYYSWDRQSWTQLGNNYGDWGITSFYRYAGTDSGMFYIINPPTSSAKLYVSDIFAYNNSSWILDISPTTLTISPGDSAPVYVNIDTFALPFNNYIDSLAIISNAAKSRSAYFIPIILDYNSEQHAGINAKYSDPNNSLSRIINNNVSNSKVYLSKSILNNKHISAFIFDLSGKTLYKSNDVKRGYIDIKKFPSGIYFIRINTNGMSYADKFVKIQ